MAPRGVDQQHTLSQHCPSACSVKQTGIGLACCVLRCPILELLLHARFDFVAIVSGDAAPEIDKTGAQPAVLRVPLLFPIPARL